jgi:hypothetical protein
MITIGTRKRLCIGGWILLALLLVGHNGFKLMSFLNPELPEYSRAVKMAREKWQQLERRAAQAMIVPLGNINLDRIFVTSANVPNEQKRNVPNPKPQSATEKKIMVKLPSLTGILRISDVNGNMRSLAVIEGKNLSEGDRVKEFVVKKIRKDGIILARGGARWFVPLPEVKFSLDQGG